MTRTRRLGLLVRDQMRIDDRWVIVAGLRHDKASTTVEGGDKQEDSANSKNLGAVCLAGSGRSPYVNYSESFEPVSGTSN